MGYNLVEAGAAVGMSKNGVLKAIRRGALSASRTETGGWSIDPAELHRVYPPKAPEMTTVDPVLEEVRARLADAQAVIRDLQDRLTESDRERTRLTTLLTHQQPTRSRWWQRK